MSQRRKALPAALWALGAGLLAFLALESAVARRAGLDLLLPVSGGALLPGRLARLCACLVAAFALALTDRGRSLSRALDRFCERDRGRWAVSALVTALFFAWALRVTVLSYMTIDDVSFLQATARVPQEGLGAVRNTLAHSSQENASSLSVLLCLALGQLYRLDPDGYWYLGYHLAVLLGSLAVIGRCVLTKTCRRSWSVWAGCAVHGLLCAGVFLYTFAKIAFTVTPAVAGSAAAALLLCRHHERTRAGRVRCDGLSGLLMVLCCLQRRATGYCLLCFWALALAYQVLRSVLAGREGLKKRLGALGLCAVATLAVIGGALAAGDAVEGDENYRQAEYYRSLVGDYLNDRVTYDQYAQAGIPQELASLIYGWYFMDQRVTTDTFRQLAGIYYADLAAQDGPSLPARAAGAVMRLAGTVAEDRQMLVRAGCAAALLLGCLAAAVRYGRRYWPELLCALCAAGGAGVLLLYLIWDGRFLLRVFLVVALPAVVMLLLLALSAPDERPDAPRPRRIAAGTLAALAGTALSCLCLAGVYITPYAAQALTRDDVFARQYGIEDYVNAQPEITFVTSIYDDFDACADPLHSAYAYPENLVTWGYCGDLAKDAADRLYAEDFFRDDVLFMTDSPVTIPMLLQYLSLDWGPVRAVTLAHPTPGVTVCRMERIAPAPGYTGWYEQDGMTYYFRDGEPLAGEQTVGGRRCTFAAAGAQAGMSAVPGPDGPIYLTDAYRLLPDAEDAS